VFDILVKNKSDTLQLLAYAMYCVAKNNRANQLHKEGKSQVEIEAELKRYHTYVASDTTMQRLLHNEAQNVHAVYTRKIEQKVVKEFIKKVQTDPINKTSKRQWVAGKLTDAVSSILASVLVIVLCVGFASLFAGKEKRDALFEAGTEEAKNMMKGEIPVVDKYNAIMDKKNKKLVQPEVSAIVEK
ncbi:hypothetical protein, partial [Citrobacter portucalensis]|uniref:hypothetical protein n=1 Tax=Citrobacter portucalensis TaxID=1639133 RepID=UPI0021127416